MDIGTNGRQTAADRLEDAADSLREKTSRPEYGRLGEMAGRTAGYMASTAQYVRSHDMQEMWRDLDRLARRRPSEFIAGALILGMVIGRALGDRKNV